MKFLLKSIQYLSLLTFLFFPFYELSALRIGFLPVQISSSTAQVLQEKYPLLDSEDARYELARLYQSVFQLSKSPYAFLPVKQQQIEFLYNQYKKNKTTFYNQDELKLIGKESNSEALFISELSYSQNKFFLQTSLYYTSSNLQTDYIKVSCSQAHQCFYLALKKRFSHLTITKTSTNAGIGSWIFLIDAIAANQKEILALSSYVEKISFRQATLCAVTPDGKSSFTAFQESSQDIAQILRHLRTVGGNNSSFDSLISCGQRQAEKLKEKPRVIFLTGSVPDNIVASKGALRRLASQSKLSIFATSALRAEKLSFWKNLAQELQYAYSASYHDVLYRQKLGLSDGQEVYVFKQGNKITESFDSSLDSNDFTSAVVAHKAEQFSAQNLSKFYEEMSKNQVVAKREVEILLNGLPTTFTNSPNNNSVHSIKTMRVLLNMEGKSFWIRLPLSEQTRLLEKNNSYYFLLELLPPQNGMAFYNNPTYGKVFFDKRETSSLLYLPIHSYLKNSSSFLQRSVDASSFYYVFAQVKAILY